MQTPSRLAAEVLKACGQTTEWTPLVADALARKVDLWELLYYFELLPLNTEATECLLSLINMSMGV